LQTKQAIGGILLCLLINANISSLERGQGEVG